MDKRTFKGVPQIAPPKTTGNMRKQVPMGKPAAAGKKKKGY